MNTFLLVLILWAVVFDVKITIKTKKAPEKPVALPPLPQKKGSR